MTQAINGFITVVQTFLLPTFYQLAYGYSPVKSGAMVLPITLVMSAFLFSPSFPVVICAIAATSSACGFYISSTGRYREPILLGWCIWAVGLGLLSTMDQRTPVSRQIGYSLLTGFGIGQTFQPSLVAVQGAVERKDMAVITSLRNFVRSLGGTIGLAICGTIV